MQANETVFWESMIFHVDLLMGFAVTMAAAAAAADDDDVPKTFLKLSWDREGYRGFRRGSKRIGYYAHTVSDRI